MGDLQKGQRFRLLRKIGNDTNADGSPGYPLAAGSIGTVREIVPAEVEGAHNSEEDAVVLEFDHVPSAYIDASGQAQLAQSSRAVSFALTDFDDPTTFEAVQDAAEEVTA